jgi:hypothetical protein
VVGAIWYSPVAFGPLWQRTVGITQDKMLTAMPKAIAVGPVGSLLMAFILLRAVTYPGADTLGLGGIVGALNRLGFVAVVVVLFAGSALRCL